MTQVDEAFSQCRKAFDIWYDEKINSDPAYYNGFDYSIAFLGWQAAWNTRHEPQPQGVDEEAFEYARSQWHPKHIREFIQCYESAKSQPPSPAPVAVNDREGGV